MTLAKSGGGGKFRDEGRRSGAAWAKVWTLVVPRLLAIWTAWIARPALAVVLAGLVAAAALLPGLGRPGLWEPQELAVADAALARVETDKANARAEAERAKATPGAARPATAPPAASCLPGAPPDAMSRSLPRRALQWVLRDGPASEGALRLPMALLGVLTVLASAGLAARLAGARAALLCALLLLSFPLLVMQSRQLTSELGTAAGAALILYGLVSLRPIGHTLYRAVAARHPHRAAPTLGRGVLHLLDDALSLLALAAGLGLGFLGGGALLGVLVPVLAFAAVTGLGSRGLSALSRLGRGLMGRLLPRRRGDAGHPPPLGSWVGDPSVTWLGAKGLAATAFAVAILYVLVDHAYKLGVPQVGTRQLLGHSLVPTSCYSWALGGTWQGHDDLRVLYDSSVEQIAFGTYPWGLLAPLAVIALLMSRQRPERLGGALCLAWGAAAWVATEAFQRKVGHVVYAGFPAIALAVALWLDAGLTWSAARAPGAAAPGDGGDDSPASWRARISSPLAGRVLIGLFFLLGAVTLGKDLQSFPERLTSLMVGDDAVKYPALARWLWIPTRVWVLALGTGAALATALWLWSHPEEPTPPRLAMARIQPRALAVALALTAALAAFWVHGWQASLSRLLSSKSMFATYRELRKPGDPLLVYGDLGNAPRYYAGGPYQTAMSREEVLGALAGKPRVFALVPAGELCSIHRQVQGPYAVLDNDNPRTVLLSNSAAGGRDHNPLTTSLYRSEPRDIATRPPSPIVLENTVEIIGWKLPRAVRRGERFEVTIYYKLLAPMGGTWKVFQHYDRGGARFIGDHVPIGGRCPTIEWQTGDYIVDRHSVLAGAPGLGNGSYELWTGFFTGVAPSWRNMKVTQAPKEMLPEEEAAGAQGAQAGEEGKAKDRVKLGSILLR